MINCVYRFLDENGKIIYIGKAKDLKSRIKGHTHLPKECYKERKSIEFVAFETEDEMDLAERYYIPKFKPKYNELMVEREITFSIDVFDSKKWNEYAKVGVGSKRTEKQRKREEQKLIERQLKKRKMEEDRQKRFEVYLAEQEKKKQEKREEFEKKLSKKVMCMCTGEIFDSLRDVSERYKTPVEWLVKHCDGEKNSLLITHPVYKELVTFMYYNEFLSLDTYLSRVVKDGIRRDTSKVICITTGELFINANHVCLEYNLNKKNIIKCCEDVMNYTGSIDEKPMVWKYYDEYCKMSDEKVKKYIDRATEIYNNQNKKNKRVK